MGFSRSVNEHMFITPRLEIMSHIGNWRERANQTQPAQYFIFDDKAIVKQFMLAFRSPDMRSLETNVHDK